MSAPFVEAAPGSRISGGAYDFQAISAQANVRSRSSLSKKRAFHDAQTLAASPDVISNLLASFESISAPSEESDLHPALRTQSPRSSSVGLNQRYVFSAKAVPAPVAEYASPDRLNSFTVGTWTPDDAAEPPIVRTNRAFSRSGFAWNRLNSSPKISIEQSRSHTIPDETGVQDWSAELLQPDDQLSPLPGDNLAFSGYQSPPYYRASLDGPNHESERQSRRSSFSKDAKGKGRAVDVPETRPPRTDTFDTRRHGGILTPSTSSLRWTSRHSTASSSISGGVGSVPFAGPSKSNRRFSSADHLSKDYKAKERLKSYQSLEANGPALLDSKLVVPPRGSSLKRVDSLTLLRRRGSIRSTISLIPEPAIKTFVPTVSLDHEIEDNSADLNAEESDVLKRIKELKAANEARRISLQEQGVREISKDRVMIPPPQSTLTKQQALPTTHVSSAPIKTTFIRIKPDEVLPQDEPRPSTSGVSEGSFAMSSTISSLTRASIDILPVEYVNFSRDRPTVIRSVSPSRTGGSVDTNYSKDRPTHLKRWSQPAPEPRPPEKAQNKGSPLARPPIAEQKKISETIVSDSVSTYLQSPRFSRKIYIHKENRSIAFSEVGDPKGHAIFCCVGMGMTRYIMTFYDDLAKSLKLRLITPDRPGIGDSDPYSDGSRKPISWPDDVQAICDHLGVVHFSLLAHSAGAIYALATALRMPSSIRGKIHLLAPWIPPSQMTVPVFPGELASTNGSSPARVLPRSQRFLRILPTPFFKLSTSSWALNAAFVRSKNQSSPRSKSSIDRFRSSSDTNTSGPSPRISFGQLRAAITRQPSETVDIPTANLDDVLLSSVPDNNTPMSSYTTGNNSITSTATTTETPPTPTVPTITRPSTDSNLARQRHYDTVLTPAIWEMATKNANPTVDLLICLERQHTIGFRYADVDVLGAVENDLTIEQIHCEDHSPTMIGIAAGTGYDVHAGAYSTERTNGNKALTSIVIHHGSKDARVPLENVKWLSKTMKATEVRIVEGQGHGLMASAGVMSSVLTEMGRELDEL